MGGDRQGSKSGRYVGGFLQLFDWNAKSRKKLFTSRSDLPELSKQGKQCEGNLPMTRMRVVEDEEFGGEFYTRGGSEYSYASSFTDDDGYGTKAPNVVARLMGLDSMPMSSGMDLYPSSFSDTLSFQEAPFRGRNLEFYRDQQIMHSTSKPRTTLNRPIEKFQTEMLPPKSAKTIPITHHKLLSPIKSPIFVPSQDAAHVMEAAAKIIEPGPQATSRAKISSLGSSSVPFKVREMREKLEATQKPVKVESSAVKHLKGQSFRVSPSREDGSDTGKSKGKSISLAIQAKVNVQKREGLSSSGRSLASEDQNDTKTTHLIRNQVSSSKSSNRKSSSQTTSVLRQNNQKQNCASYRDKPGSKKTVIEDVSHGRHKSSSRDGERASRTSSRKSGLHARDVDKGTPYSGARNVSRKKRSIDGSLSNRKHENQSQSTKVADMQHTWIEENRRKGMDVVSFTFTAPITRSLPISESLRQLADKRNDLGSLPHSDITVLSSSGFKGIKGDALSILLEHKLKELTSSLESPDISVNTSTGTDSALGTVFSPGSVESVIEKAREKSAKEVRVNGMNPQVYSGLANDPRLVRRVFNFQAGETVEDYSNNTETKQWNCHLPSPVSILEPSMLSESCYSSESLGSNNTEESKPCSSVLAQEVPKFDPMEIDIDTWDSASSTSSQITTTKDPMKRTISWELGYVKNILCNVELMFKDYVTGRTREIVNPHLFDQLERRMLIEDDKSKVERKVLFDCVGECLDLKCQRFVGGGFDLWTKGISMLKRNDRLAEEVYKEIHGWRSSGNCMVDELVDKDMSSKYGKWLDFEVDEFMLGVEIEDEILDSLVCEIVDDLLHS